MDRRDFFKFLRDGGAALAAAVTVGIPKKEASIFDDIKDIATPKYEAIEKISEAVKYPESLESESLEEGIAKHLRNELPGVPVYTNRHESYGLTHIQQHENCGCDNVAEFIDTGIWSGINWQEIE